MKTEENKLKDEQNKLEQIQSFETEIDRLLEVYFQKSTLAEKNEVLAQVKACRDRIHDLRK